MQHPSTTAAAAALLLALLAGSVIGQEWQLGRATYFGAPESFSATFDPFRGKGSFGVLSGGSCGFTNSDNSIPFPRDAVAALADSRPDYPGEPHTAGQPSASPAAVTAAAIKQGSLFWQ